MATLTVKARAKPADEIAKQDPATLSGASPGREKDPIRQAVDEIPASCRSLREYLKTNH